MFEKQLDEFYDLLSSPIYLYVRKNSGRYFVDKITKREDRFERHRYLIEGNQCSCLSWMKVGRCKHLEWLQGNFDRLNGVPAATALAALNDLVHRSTKLFPKSHKKWWVGADQISDIVAAIQLETIEPLGFSRLVTIQTIRKYKLAFVFTYEEGGH